jgi:hypothetical protein
METDMKSTNKVDPNRICIDIINIMPKPTLVVVWAFDTDQSVRISNTPNDILVLLEDGLILQDTTIEIPVPADISTVCKLIDDVTVTQLTEHLKTLTMPVAVGYYNPTTAQFHIQTSADIDLAVLARKLLSRRSCLNIGAPIDVGEF